MTRVLIIKTSSMGDIVHNLPVIADLRRQHPDFIVDWVVEEAYADLARLARGVDRVLLVALRRWRQAAFRAETRTERRAFFEHLQAEHYDVVLDTQGLVKSAWLARRAHLAPDGFRAGFSLGLVRERPARLFYHRGFAVDPRLHAVERMRALAARTFGDDPASLGPPRFELDVPPGPLPWLPSPADHAAARYVVVLHATARAEKAWPPERWTALIGHLAAAGLTAVLPSGNAAERAAAEQLAAGAAACIPAAAPSPLVAPTLSLTEAAVLLRDARAVVGVDTGLLHLAAALDTPTVGLFGATPRWRYAPYWSSRSINLGSFGTLGSQPALRSVLDALRNLGVLPVDVVD